MWKPNNAGALAIDILGRSSCMVQVGAAIADNKGIFSWGWNGPGADGLGTHAECHAISRANQKRLRGATIYVASMRQRNGKIVISKPCEDCQKVINKWRLRVRWRNYDGSWING